MADPNDVPIPSPDGALPVEVVAAVSQFGRAMHDYGRLFADVNMVWDYASGDIAALAATLLRWDARRVAAAREHALEEAVQLVWRIAEEYSAIRESPLEKDWMSRSATAQVIAMRLRTIPPGVKLPAERAEVREA